MKTIFILIPNLAAGGAERVTITIARLLKQEGHQVEFVNLGRNQGEMLSWIEPEFTMISMGYNRVLLAFPALLSFMKNHPESLYFSSREHVNLVGLLAAKIAKESMVVRIPNMPRNVLSKGIGGFKMKVIKTVNQWLLRTAKKIIAQNQEMRNQLLDYYHLQDDKVVVINNPVDKDFVIASAEGSTNPYRENEKNFLSVCNIAYSKGIDILIEAWPKVKEVIPSAHMYIIGRDNSDYAVKQKQSAAALEDFTFLGFRSNPYPFMKFCDVFVLPSRMEGFPNVILEAMCFNKPIASTTCVEVIKDIVKEGKNGFTCGIEDVDGLSSCIIRSAHLQRIDNNYSLFDKERLINCFL